MQDSLGPRPSALPVPFLKRQAKSLTTLATPWVIEKSGGSVAGTPPKNGAASGQSFCARAFTSNMPLPNGCDDSINKAGRTVGSVALQFNVRVPTGTLVPPGRPSSTSENP